MTEPNHPTPLQAALTRIAKKVGTVQKDATNDHHGYKYASANAVLSAVRDACAEEGVAIVNTMCDVIPTATHDQLVTVRIVQTYALGDEHAQFMGMGSGKDSQDKAVMKANTAAVKYLLAAAFNISWGDDPEASEPGETKTKGSAKPAARRQKAEPKGAAPNAADIAACTTLEELEGVKARIIALGKDDPARGALVKAHNDKKAALKAAAEKN